MTSAGQRDPIPDPDRPSLRDRFRGALLGLAVGDALGTTLEFKKRGTFQPITDIVGGGRSMHLTHKDTNMYEVARL